MNRRNFLRATGMSAVGATAIIQDEAALIATADGSPPAKHDSGPDRIAPDYGPAIGGPPDQPPETSQSDMKLNQTATDRSQFVLSGQLTGNYSSDMGQIQIGLPGENKSGSILSNGSFAVDVPRDTFIDITYVEENEDGPIVFNGNPDIYYIKALEQISEDRDLGTIEIPEANVLDLKFEDGSEDPLDNIFVGVRSLDTETDRWWQISTSTNADGFYQSPNSPTGIELSGDVQVAVIQDTDDPRVPDLDVIVDGRLSVTEPRFETYTVDPITVSGEFVRPNGAPVIGDNVSVYIGESDSVTATTDEQGSFDIQLPKKTNLPKGAYQLPKGVYQIQYYRAGLLNRDEEIAGGSWVEMYAGPQLDGTIDEDVGTIQLPEGSLATVRVVDADGNPVENATIDYRHQNQSQGTRAALFYPTDGAGVIDIDGRSGIRLAGMVDVFASPPGADRFADTTVEKRINVNETVTVEIKLQFGLEPDSSIVGKYDVDGDGDITASELGDAVTDFGQGELSASELGEVVIVFGQS
jgi:hypothetical protein